MPLTKAQIIEIQEAAKFNYMRRLREQEDKKELKVRVAEKVAEATKAAEVKESDKKGK